VTTQKNVKGQKYYWVAINGSAVPATLLCPMPTPTVTPTPQVLLGFPTRKKAADTQHFLLTAPVLACRGRLSALKGREDVAFITFHDPGRVDPQVPTRWEWVPGGEEQGVES